VFVISGVTKHGSISIKRLVTVEALSGRRMLCNVKLSGRDYYCTGVQRRDYYSTGIHRVQSQEEHSAESVH
jgi:hypothetical protein